MLHAQDHAEHVGVERGGIAFRGLVRDRPTWPSVPALLRDIEAAESRTVRRRGRVLRPHAERRRMNSASAPSPRSRCSPASSRRPATTTRAPSLAKAMAVARPIPVRAPVIKTTGLLISPVLPDMPPGGRLPVHVARMGSLLSSSEGNLGSSGAEEKDFVGWIPYLIGMGEAWTSDIFATSSPSPRKAA